MIGKGWWVEKEEKNDETMYTPTLQLGGMCLSLPIWFRTEKECEEFIETYVIGQEMLAE